MTREELLTAYRGVNVEDFWWDPIYASFEVRMLTHGVEVEEIYHTGFWSQGDGACFTGHVTDWTVFLKSIGEDGNAALVRLAKDHWTLKVSHNRRSYYHEESVYLDSDLPAPVGDQDDVEWFVEQCSPYSPEDFRTTAWLATIRQVDVDNLVAKAREVFRNHMRQLYRDLEAEYEHLTSDELVWETIVANGWDKELNKENDHD
jgi:hypothetical protein